MTTLYKLTTQDNFTRKGVIGETLWSEGFRLETDGAGDLCGPGYVHAYTDPLLAVLLNPIHADINDPKLWECDGIVAKTDHGLKIGCTSLTMIRTIPLPAISTTQHVRFGILCALAIYTDPAFTKWARGWLTGEDRTKATAAAAAAEGRAAAVAAETRAVAAEAWARAAAAEAAEAWAAEAAEAWAAARAAAGAAEAADLDLKTLAYEAMKET